MIRLSRVGAIAVVSALGVVAAGVFDTSPHSNESTPSQPAAETSARIPPPAVGPPSTVAVGVVTGPTTPANDDLFLEPIDVARRGLEAWGRFAASGDLDEVASWFSSGPQWERFVEETKRGGVDGVAYSVSLTEVEVSEVEDEAVVLGRVVFVRTGEAAQVFRWRIVLVFEGREWRIWTVEEAE